MRAGSPALAGGSTTGCFLPGHFPLANLEADPRRLSKEGGLLGHPTLNLRSFASCAVRGLDGEGGRVSCPPAAPTVDAES